MLIFYHTYPVTLMNTIHHDMLNMGAEDVEIYQDAMAIVILFFLIN